MLNRRTKQNLIIVVIGVVLFAVLMNFSTALQLAGNAIGIVSPILIGLIIAFVLNVPMHAIEKMLQRITGKRKNKPLDSVIRIMSLVITLACIALIVGITVNLAIPALVESYRSIEPLLMERMPEWAEWLEDLNIDTTAVMDWLTGFDISGFSDDAGNFLTSAMSTASSAVSGVINVVFGIVIAIYVLLSKPMMYRQVKKIVYANISNKKADRIYYICSMLRETYSKFLSGQCVEAIILGSLIFIGFSIFRLPYAPLIGFLTGICSFVPYVGGFCSCAVAMFLILLADPSKIFISIIVYVIIQFVENQFIYPHVVGNSVGLAPVWTLLAALIGGKLFGLSGIIFFIPLAAVVFFLLKENTMKKLERKRDDETEMTTQ